MTDVTDRGPQAPEILSDSERVARVREALPVFRTAAYLNTGTAGPLPTATAEAMARESRWELERGRSTLPDRSPTLRESAAALREKYARLVNASPDEIALTRSTTDGVNIGLWGIEWEPGDRVLTSNLEHEGVLVPLWHLERRGRITVERVDVGVGLPSQVMDAFERALATPARMIAISHVAYSTGAVFPLKELVELAHRKGTLVLVDAAQSIGAMPIDLPALGADFYAMPGQKWLCGPEGMGALYVPERHWDTLHSTYGGFGSLEPMGTDPTPFALGAGARRFEMGHNYTPLYEGQIASLDWLEETGWDWVHARNAHLSAYCAEVLSQVPGVEPFLPVGAPQGLVSVEVEGVHAAEVAPRLVERGFIVRSVREPRAIRASTGFYNTEAELDGLRDALAEVLKELRP
jgi:L-cysteine/cystine lyase